MNVLVTGSTGFVGRHLVPRLVAAGHEVRLLARGRQLVSKCEHCTLCRGDVASGAGLDEAVEGVDALIHLVAVIRETGSYTFERVNHLGTANVVATMRRQGVRRLLHMSALGATPDPTLRYGYSKWLGEEAVRQSGLEYTVFRPSLVFGPDDGFVAKLRHAVAPIPIVAPVPGTGQTRFQPVWVEDIVTCLLLSLSDGSRIGQTYELGGPEYLTYDEMLEQVLHALELRRIKLHIPLAIMRPAVATIERVWPDPPITSAELAQLAFDNITALDSVERQFGFPPARFRDKTRLRERYGLDEEGRHSLTPRARNEVVRLML